jgi:predicted nucleic acid-binding protein
VKNALCLDTGIITQLYSKNPPKQIKNLMKKVKNKEIIAYVVYPILVEVYYQICRLSGQDAAEARVASFLHNYPVRLVNLNKSLIFKAGKMKCQHSNILSYIDCLAIAFSLNKKITLHTTEKNLGEIFPDLKLEEYYF